MDLPRPVTFFPLFRYTIYSLDKYMTKEELLALTQLCQNGDTQAFGELYEYFLPKIYPFIYYQVKHRETAEDLTSLTFSKALDKIKQFKKHEANFSAWLYQIARNTVTDHWRTNKITYEIDMAQTQSTQTEVSREFDAKQKLNQVEEKLEKLNPEQKEIIIMRLWQELSYEEISQILNKSEASCKMSFSRSIKQLRQNLALYILLFINLIY